LEKRRRWERFNPQLLTTSAPKFDDWIYIELINGYLAYLPDGAGANEIFFDDLSWHDLGAPGDEEDRAGNGTWNDGGEEDGERNHRSQDKSDKMWSVKIPNGCQRFTFDLAQDLLVTLHRDAK
jgi:hypothetical protein